MAVHAGFGEGPEVVKEDAPQLRRRQRGRRYPEEATAPGEQAHLDEPSTPQTEEVVHSASKAELVRGLPVMPLFPIQATCHRLVE